MVAEYLNDQSTIAYILVTPVKDEEDNLPTLIESIVNQTLRPVVWFIVDDGSRDHSAQIIEQAASAHSWIRFVRAGTDRAYDIGEHYASVCIIGFRQAFCYCEQNNLSFKYIALSDADMIYPEDYFAKCISFLESNKGVGIVSGKLLVSDKSGNSYEEAKVQLGDGQPRGTGRVWRREAFMDTGGYIRAKAPDTVSNIKAILRGWKIRRLANLRYYQTRDTGAKMGLWDGYFNKGQAAYYLNVNPLGMLNAIVVMIFVSRERRSAIKSLAFLYGYCKSLFVRAPRLEDDEVKRYFGSYSRIFRNYRLFLKGLGKKK